MVMVFFHAVPINSKNLFSGVPLVAQQVKDAPLFLMAGRFNPWPYSVG